MRINKNLLFYISVIPIAIIAFNFSFAAEPERIALLPFKVNAEKDMSFLRDGIFDMLSSRLSKEGQVEVISRKKTEEAVEAVAGTQAVNEAKAREIGTRLNANYALFGSLTILGNSVSIDSKMVDVSGAKPTMTFFDQVQDLGEVIPKIDHMAAEINEKLFGRVSVTKKTPSEPESSRPEQPSIYAHPEKLLEKGGGGAGEDSTGSPFIMARETKESTQSFWRSPKFKHLINGLTLGDVDGDGKIETIVITPDSLIIYRSEGGRFLTVQEISEGNQKQLIGVDVADINQNGTNEIFVTSLNAYRKVLNSYVLEYNGQNFIKIVDNSPWYYRIADLPTRGKILLGQKQSAEDPFSGPIYEMIWQNSEYAPGEKIRSPRGINVMGLTIGDVLNNGQETTVAYTREDRIRVVESSGKEIWQGSEQYGGSTLYYAGAKEDRGDVVNPRYLPMRLVVMDLNGDRKSEVIVAKNYEMSARKLERFRKFNNSQLDGLIWDGLGLASSWQTRKISGFIRDFAIGDFDNDGKDEIVAAVVLKEGNIALISTPESTIIAYEFSSQGS